MGPEKLKVTLILTEKPSISRAICRMFIPDGAEPDRYSATDIFGPIGINEQKKFPPRMYFLESLAGSATTVAVDITSDDAFTGDLVRETREKLGRRKRSAGEEVLKFYAVAADDGSLIVIVDTSGNPLSYSFRRKLYDIIGRNEDYREVLKGGYYALGSGKKSDRGSSKMRLEFISCLLVKEQLPFPYAGISSGADIELKQIVAATDDDIAGHTIFASFIEYANALRKSDGKDPIDRRKTAKLSPEKLERNLVQKKLVEPDPISLSRELGGKARSVLDHFLGITFSSEVNKHNHSDRPYVFGRVLWLALKTLVEEEKRLYFSNQTDYAYLVFPGQISGTDLSTNLSSGNYCLISAATQEERITTGRFLQICAEKNIGTLTTRYRVSVRGTDFSIQTGSFASSAMTRSIISGSQFS